MSGLIYVNILADALKNKKSVLKSILILTENQQQMLKEVETFKEASFMEIISKKQQLIEKLDTLDSGFERVYAKVKKELEMDVEMYQKVVLEMQDHIKQITELSVKIQALEKQNKIAVDRYLSGKKENLKKSMVNNQGVSHYYKSMAGSYQANSLYIDQKK